MLAIDLKGNVVRFNYAGGSNPGSRRLVYVISVLDRNLKTWDLDKNEPRNFAYGNCSNTVVQNSDSLCTRMLNDGLITSLQNSWLEDGYCSYYLEDSNLLIRFKNEPEYTVTFDKTTRSTAFASLKGGVGINENGLVTYDVDGKRVTHNRDATALEIMQAIASLI